MEIGLAKPSRILQKANLTHDRLVKYLGELNRRRLIEENTGNRLRYYTLTDSGFKFLVGMYHIDSFLSEFGFYV